MLWFSSVIIIASLGRIYTHRHPTSSLFGTDGILRSCLSLTILPIVSSLPVLSLRIVVAYLWGTLPLPDLFCRDIRLLSFAETYGSCPLPRHTALVPVNSIPLQKNFGELLQFWVQLSLSASSLVFGHLHWSFWNVWSNILYEGFPSWSLATGFSILLIWLIIRSLAILPSAYPDSPGVGFSILLLLILQIDGRMFSHHPPFLCLTFPGLTFLIATFHPFQSILPIDPRVLIV